jgi:cysteine sulfinate desulfinase/cysteine desulfurase-like protein
VLTALGLSEAAALGSIRIGLGRSNSPEQTARFIDDAKRAVAKLREISAA